MTFAQENGEQRPGTELGVHLRAPGRIGQIDPQRRTDVFELRISPPCLDALQMLVVQVARPPGDGRKMAGEIDHVLAGAAADLDDIAGFAGEEWPQRRADRPVDCDEGRRVEPAAGSRATTVLAEFDDIVDHGSESSWKAEKHRSSA
jgi:hypothetical protein